MGARHVRQAAPRSGTSILSAVGMASAATILEDGVQKILESNTFNFKNILLPGLQEAASDETSSPPRNAFVGLDSSKPYRQIVENMTEYPIVVTSAEVILSQKARLGNMADQTSEEYKQLESKLKYLEDEFQEAVSDILKKMEKEIKALYAFATENAERLCRLETKFVCLRQDVQETKKQAETSTMDRTRNTSDIANLNYKLNTCELNVNNSKIEENTSNIASNASKNNEIAASVVRNNDWIEIVDAQVQEDSRTMDEEKMNETFAAQELQTEVFNAERMTFAAAQKTINAAKSTFAAAEEVMQVAIKKMNAVKQNCKEAKDKYHYTWD